MSKGKNIYFHNKCWDYNEEVTIWMYVCQRFIRERGESYDIAQCIFISRKDGASEKKVTVFKKVGK